MGGREFRSGLVHMFPTHKSTKPTTMPVPDYAVDRETGKKYSWNTWYRKMSKQQRDEIKMSSRGVAHRKTSYANRSDPKRRGGRRVGPAPASCRKTLDEWKALTAQQRFAENKRAKRRAASPPTLGASAAIAIARPTAPPRKRTPATRVPQRRDPL